MAAVINSNILAQIAQTNLNRSASSMGTAIERLSSGLRINNAKDDAAGQAIASRMNAKLRGISQASRNANDGISLLQTQESALSEINNNLLRIRELSVQAASGTNSAKDRESIQNEIDQRVEEIGRIASASEFNGVKLLDGAAKEPLVIQVGAGTSADDSISIAMINATTTTLGVKALKVDSAKNAHAAIVSVDKAMETLNSARSNIGAKQNRFESTINDLANVATNLAAARSRIEDADYAAEVSSLTRGQILQQAGQSVLAQANQVPMGVLGLLR